MEIALFGAFRGRVFIDFLFFYKYSAPKGAFLSSHFAKSPSRPVALSPHRLVFS
jgi:hypothetical protein